MRLLAVCVAVCVALSAAAPPASALSVTNEGDETINVWIENWQYRLRKGRTTTFIPSKLPAAIIFENRHMRITCEAGADSEVRVNNEQCTVDGVPTGENRFQI